MFLSKYGVARHIYIPIIKRAVVDFAVSADWTPVAGDVKISKAGAAAADVTNLPTAITMGGTAMWDFSLTATEMQAAQIMVSVADAATKAVEDQFFIIETYGNASAQHAVDLSDSVRAGLTALPNAAAEAAGGLYTRGTGAGQIRQDANGRIDANAKAWIDGTIPAVNVTGVPKVDVVDLLGSAPNALVSGRIDASVGAMAANVITATAINADAINDSKVAADVTIASVTGAVGSVTGNVGGNVTGSVGSVASGGIVAASFGAGAINAAAIAADAIGASELAADAVAEIAAAVGGGGAPTAAQVADAVWDELASDHVGAGTMGQKLNAAGGAADPLTNQVPGTYGAGTAGAALGRIGTGGVTVTVASPVAVDGTITLVRGDDYFAADGVPIDFAFTALPYSFVGALSVKLTLKHRTSGQVVTFTGTVLSASSLRFQPTSAETSALVANLNSGFGPNAYTYDVEVKLANGHTVTPQIGKANVREGIS